MLYTLEHVKTKTFTPFLIIHSLNCVCYEGSVKSRLRRFKHTKYRIQIDACVAWTVAYLYCVVKSSQLLPQKKQNKQLANNARLQ